MPLCREGYEMPPRKLRPVTFTCEWCSDPRDPVVTRGGTQRTSVYGTGVPARPLARILLARVYPG